MVDYPLGPKALHEAADATLEKINEAFDWGAPQGFSRK
jgi:hypothetical protein